MAEMGEHNIVLCDNGPSGVGQVRRAGSVECLIDGFEREVFM